MCILMLLFMSVDEKTIEVRYTDIPPQIDGYIEEIWQQADSVTDFIQFMPYEKMAPSEKTTVYILQNDKNLYVAYRCYTTAHKLINCFTENDDHVSLYLDTFDSKTTAYFFKASVSGLILDGIYLDDGRFPDRSWDGVWYRAAQIYDDRYEVEIRVPFKSIRYKKGLSEWGINFKRYIAGCHEYDFWTEYTHKGSFKVSNFGKLRGINPQAVGHYVEIYPEGFLRYDEYAGENARVKPRASMNVKWDLSPQTTLNATVFPDFAQIESDPFMLNLSRYPTYLSERRPFFIEGSEIFRMSNFGEGQGFFLPLNLFYSRKIGKSISGELVDILGGMKLTTKSHDWNIGILGVYTDSLQWDSLNSEPRKGFGAFRLSRNIMENSNIGMLFSGSIKDQEDYNYAFGLDGVYRSGANQFVLQSAISNRNEKTGLAIASGFNGYIKNLLTSAGVIVVQDSFDISDIGFVPWVGKKQFMAFSGPFYSYPEGYLRQFYIAIGTCINQEPGVTGNWSKTGILTTTFNFRNHWGINTYLQMGPYYETEAEYFGRYVSVSLWKMTTKYSFNLNSSLDYAYNYYRGYLGYIGSSWISFDYSLIPHVNLMLSSNIWVEFDTLHTVAAITPSATPRIEFTITPDMTLSIFNEFVMNTPQTDFSETELYSNRLGLLFSWNFLPKSWFYLAINDYQEQDEQGSLQPLYRIGAIKVKYLLYF